MNRKIGGMVGDSSKEVLGIVDSVCVTGNGDSVVDGNINVADIVTMELNLAPTFTIAEVAGVHQSMLGLLESASRIVLDGSEVDRVDGAGIQLLVAFVEEAKDRQIEVSWSGASVVLRSAAVQLGLGNLLKLEAVI